MKKLFIILTSLFLFVAFSQAQIAYPKAGAANNFSYTGTAADTSGTANVSIYKVIDCRALTGWYGFSLNVNVDDFSGNVAGHAIKVEGSVDATTYTTLYTYTMSDADALYNVTTQDTVYYNWPYLRVHLDSDGTGVTKILSIYGKVSEKK